MDPLQPSHRFHAHLFGAFTFRRGKQVVPLPASANALALFAYLLLHREQPHPRAVLVQTILSRSIRKPRAARAQASALAHRCVLPRFIETDADAPIWVDVEEFKRISDFSFINPSSEE